MSKLEQTTLKNNKDQLLKNADFSVDNELTILESKPESASPTKTNIDWEDRHFRICLALLSRTDLCSYHNSTVSTVEPRLNKIIETADKMVEQLRVHNAEKFANSAE